MKKIIKLSLALALLAPLTLESCSKYEEGPAISLRSAKARLVRDWTYDKGVLASGTLVTPSGSTQISYFEKDGSFEVIGGNYSYNGTWEFNDDKTTITTTIDLGVLGSSSSTSTIIKLSSKELILEDDDQTLSYYTSN